MGNAQARAEDEQPIAERVLEDPVEAAPKEDEANELHKEEVAASDAEEKDRTSPEAEAEETAADTPTEEGGDDAAKEEEEKPSFKYTIDDVKTAPPDARFPNTNQTKHCYTRYNEFHKCQKEKGVNAPECEKFQRWYRSLCPMEWVERWDEQREAGVFCGPY